VNVFRSDLQSGQPYHKWKNRSRLGKTVGKSPHYRCSLALVLSLETGLVCSQFNVAFDPNFHAVGKIATKLRWQNKAGLVTQREPASSRRSSYVDNGRNKRAGPSKRKLQERDDNSKDAAGAPESQTSEPPGAAIVGSDGLPTPQSSRSDDSARRVSNFKEHVTKCGRKTKPVLMLVDAMVAEVGHLTWGMYQEKSSASRQKNRIGIHFCNSTFQKQRPSCGPKAHHQCAVGVLKRLKTDPNLKISDWKELMLMVEKISLCPVVDTTKKWL
jgi:hypothetical protein